MSNQVNTDLQREIATINLENDDIDMPVVPSTSQAALTSPASPTHEVAVTIDIGNSAGVYYGQFMPQPALTAEELMSDLVNPSIYQRKGFIIQFVNNNANCSPTVIGGVRTSEKDVRRIPNFLTLNNTVIRSLAVSALNRHLRDTMCGTGATEFLNNEDYGISYSLASLSPRGSTLNPSRRNEAPIFYCHLPGFTDPCYIAQLAEGGMDSAHVVNCYVHLLPANQRRNAIIAKAKEAALAEANTIEVAPTTSQNSPITFTNTLGNVFNGNKNKVARPRSNSRPRPYQHMSKQQQQHQRDANYQHQNAQHQGNPPKATIGQAINLAKVQRTKTQNPPLPATKPPTWAARSPSKDLPSHL